jgi:hypothetical protein
MDLTLESKFIELKKILDALLLEKVRLEKEIEIRRSYLDLVYIFYVNFVILDKNGV